MSDRDIVVNEFEQWCDSMNEDCPVACLDALALLKEQEEEIKTLARYARAGMIDVDALLGRSVKWE